MSFTQFGFISAALVLILLPQILAIHMDGNSNVEHEEYDYR